MMPHSLVPKSCRLSESEQGIVERADSREECMELTVHSITFDCADPRRLAGFWAAALGLEIRRMEDDLASVEMP